MSSDQIAAMTLGEYDRMKTEEQGGRGWEVRGEG